MAAATCEDRVPAAVLLAFAIALWAGGFHAIEIAAEGTSALMLSALRGGVATIVLLALIPLLGGQIPRGRKLWFWSAVSGTLMVALFYEGATEAVARAGSGNAAVLANTTPFFVLVFGRIILGERLSLRGIGGLLVGFLGVIVMMSSQLGDRSPAVLVLGMLFALLGAAGWGAGTLFIKWLLSTEQRVNLLGLVAAQHLIGSSVLLFFAFGIYGTDGTRWSQPSLWGGIAFLAIGSSAVATVAFFGALRHMTATRASAWLLLVPVGAVLIETATGTAPEPVVLVGMVMVIAGVGLANRMPE